MNDKYTIVIEWSEADAAYVAVVPELPGCMADGRTRQEAVTNVEQIIQEWIDTAKELGRPIPCKVPNQTRQNPNRQPGSAIGGLTILEDDDIHLDDFREYMQ